MENSNRITTNLYPVFKAYNEILGGSGNQMRPSQVQFIITTFEGVQNNLPVLIEGPTGLGKTKALLTVAAAYINENEQAKVIYTTRTIPQLVNVDNDLHEICSKQEDPPFHTRQSFYYVSYIGITSLKRIACSKFIDEITFDKDRLQYFRSLMPDPDKPEPCPECPRKELKGKRIDLSWSSENKQFGLREIHQLLREGVCPLPYMKQAAKNAAILVTTYPYLFDEFWKATYLGKAVERKNTLPIIDEAHNLLENLTDATSPALSINLNNNIEEGRGLDLTNNIYHLAFLINDFKYGFKNVIMGPLSDLYNDVIQNNKKKQDTNKEQRDLVKQDNKEARSDRESYESIKKQLKKIKTKKNYETISIEKIPPNWHKKINKAINLINEAHDYANERNKHQIRYQQLKNKRITLISENKKRHRKRKELQERARTQLEIMKKEYASRSNEVFEKEQEVSQEIDELIKKEDEAKWKKEQMNEKNNLLYHEGREIIDELISEIDKKAYNLDKAIIKNNKKIEELRNIQNNLKSKKKDIKSTFQELKNNNLDATQWHSKIDELANQSENNKEQVESIKKSVNFGFSLFEYLYRFRELLNEILSNQEEGVLTESRLSDLSEQLNTGLKKETNIDIFQFLELCEKAIVQFEEFQLKSNTAYEGKAIYGLKQMFRTLAAIKQGPYGFASFLSFEEDSPKISFYSLDPAPISRNLYYDLRSPILASATISPVNDVTRVLGIDHAIRAKIKPVFPTQNYLAFAFMGAHGSRTEAGGENIFNHLEKRILKNNITKILKAHSKHTGLFCASHNVLDATLQLINKKEVNKCGFKFLVARTDNTRNEDDFDELKKNLAPEIFKGLNNFDSRLKVFTELAGQIPIVIAGVSGGGLAEGVDYKGKMLEMAIIIGIPYQDEGEHRWLNDKRTGFFKMREGSLETGKDLAYRQSAIRKIAQTAGRVHRTVKDKGTIIFFDERLLGIKNTSAKGHSRYEILSPGNTARHWSIIQERILENLAVVRPEEIHAGEANKLEKRINRVFKNTKYKPKVMDFSACLESIKQFAG